MIFDTFSNLFYEPEDEVPDDDDEYPEEDEDMDKYYEIKYENNYASTDRAAEN